MSAYEYLTVFVSVILGLAVVHILSGFSLILDARERSRPFWVHLVWTHNVFVLAVATWWLNFSLSSVEPWTFLHFADLVGYSVLIYVLAGLLFPTRGPEVIDFRVHFERNRKWFFAIFAAFVPVDALSCFLEETAGLKRCFSQFYFLFMGGTLLGSVVAIRVRRELYHGVLGIIWLLLLLTRIALDYRTISGGGS